MPEFIPEHVPAGLDDFTRGYLEAMEWLLPEETNRDKLRGFTRKTTKRAMEECADFQESNGADLAEYYELSGRPEDHAGHDFYLSRNGHGAGFFDRGSAPVFDRLQDAADAAGSTYECVHLGWIYCE